MRKLVPIVTLALIVLTFTPAPTEARGRRRCRSVGMPCPCMRCYGPAVGVPPYATGVPTEPPRAIGPVRELRTSKGNVYRLGPAAPVEYERDQVRAALTADPNAFHGTSRRIAKTSFVSGTPTLYATVHELRAPLPSDHAMGQLGIPWGQGSEDSGRVDQEKQVVTVNGYLYAFSKESDNDYHCMVGDAPDDPERKFMNMEVSGLPASGPARAVLADVRSKFKGQFGLDNVGATDGYIPVDPPMPVRITGSLFYDMDHSPPRPFVSHNGFHPGSAWEVHPITAIEFEPGG
jgi:hypothetical protein